MVLVNAFASAASRLSVSRARIVSTEVVRKRQIGFAQIRQGIEGGLSIARTGDPAHQLARLAAHLVGLLAQRLAQQAKQCAPSLERLPHLVDRLGSRKLGVG